MKEKRPRTFHEEVVEITEQQFKKAKERLKTNLQKEAEEIDPRLMFLKLKKAFLEQYGRINAADTKVNDAQFNIDQLDKNLAKFKMEVYDKLENFNKFNTSVDNYISQLCQNHLNSNLQPKIKEIEQQLEFQKKIFQDAIKLLYKASTPWYKRLWKRIIK